MAETTPQTPQVRDGVLIYRDGMHTRNAQVEGDAWWQWLEAPDTTTFQVVTSSGGFTARREQRRGGQYWYAYRRRHGRLAKAYLGKSRELSLARLAAMAERLAAAEDRPTCGPVAAAMSPPPAAKPVARAHHLPLQPTPLLGREQEIHAIRELLLQSHVRLLTLAGAGGTGKTRLAIQAALGVVEIFPEGVYFVDLAALRDPSLVISSVARAIGVKETANQPLVESVTAWVRERHVLLVLDNFEHLLPAVQDLTELLVTCPFLKLLVTSREALHLRWEHEFTVQPLEVPALVDVPATAALAEVSSVALFIERAQAAHPGFVFTNDNSQTVAEICARLDGLPLAIELAASWMKVLSPQALLEQLSERRLDLLTQGPGDLPPRQRTLREAIGWSYALLHPDEQKLFRRLSVFLGGSTLQAVDVVCLGDGGEGNALKGVSSLIHKNLVQPTSDGDASDRDQEPRFRMLETIREFAFETLGASGDREAVQRQHALWCLRFAEEADAALAGSQQPWWYARLAREHDNFRAALSWTIEAGEVEIGQRIASALWRFWLVQGHLREGQRWLDRLLSAVAPTPVPHEVRARAINTAGALALELAEYAKASMHFQEALAVRQALGDKQGSARTLNNLGIVARRQGDLLAARICYEQVLALMRELDDGWGMAGALNNLGIVAHTQGAYDDAVGLHEESLALHRAQNNTWGIAASLSHLAVCARGRGEYDQARVLLQESLSLFHELGAKPSTAECLEHLSALALEQGDAEQTARLGGVASALRESIGAPLPPADRVPFEATLEAARTVLGDTAYMFAWSVGQRMSIDQAIEYVCAVTKSASSPVESSVITPLARLTRREREVAALVARGLSNRAIAEELVVSTRTIEGHVERLRGKLSLRSRAQLAAWVVRHGPAGESELGEGSKRS